MNRGIEVCHFACYYDMPYQSACDAHEVLESLAWPVVCDPTCCPSDAQGPDVVTSFLQKHDMDLVCRAHQVVEDVDFMMQKRIATPPQEALATPKGQGLRGSYTR